MSHCDSFLFTYGKFVLQSVCPHLKQRSVSTWQRGRRRLGNLGQVQQHLFMVQSVLGAPGLLQGNHDDAGVVGAQHALAPPQQSVADQLPGTRHSARCLKCEKGYCEISLQIMLCAFASNRPLKDPDRFEFKLNMLTAWGWLTIASSLFWHMEIASWGGTMFHRPSLPKMM